MGDEEPSSHSRRERPPTAPPTSGRALLSRRHGDRPSSGYLRTGPVEEKCLKRTNSDPSLLGSTEERLARWAFIRSQPEYRRMLWDIKVKQAFVDKENEEGSAGKNFQQDRTREHDSDLKKDALRSRVSPEGSKTGLPGQRRPSTGKTRSRPPEVKGILRTGEPPPSPSPSPAPSSDSHKRRQVRFRDADKGCTSRQTSMESLATPDIRAARHGSGAASRNTTEKKYRANVSMASRLGVGQISLQMSDFHRPGVTKTMSVNYSSSVLCQNSRILSEDLIRLSGHKSEARQAFVRRTERRLRILRKNRELREQTKAERDRRQRMEEEEGNQESTYFRRPEETLLARPSSEMQELLTVTEKKEIRAERIKERTMLLPENYRTANYIRDFSEEQAKTVRRGSYWSAQEGEGEGEDETVDLFPL